MFLAAMAAVAGAVWLELRAEDGGDDAARAEPASVAPSPKRLRADWDSAWDPLPGAEADPGRMQAARTAYAFVARHPEVVGYIPCFCGCSRSGHKSVESCFVSGRTAEGKPRWNPMGFG
jgi:hypothetical protein